MAKVLSYIIVGSSWRAEFCGRIARTYPDLFHALFPCRSEEKVLLMKARTGMDALCNVNMVNGAIQWSEDWMSTIAPGENRFFPGFLRNTAAWICGI